MTVIAVGDDEVRCQWTRPTGLRVQGDFKPVALNKIT